MEGEKVVPRMSLAAQFDDICRYTEQVLRDTSEHNETLETLSVVAQLRVHAKRYRSVMAECLEFENSYKRLQMENKAIRGRMEKLIAAQHLEEENKNCLQKRVNSMEKFISQIRNVVLGGPASLNDETKEKILLLSNSCLELNEQCCTKSNEQATDPASNVSSLSEINSAEDMEDGPDVEIIATFEASSDTSCAPSNSNEEGNTSPPLSGLAQYVAASSEEDVAKVVQKENVPSGRYSVGRNGIRLRLHTYHTMTITQPKMCVACGKAIQYSELAAKCRSCNALCHTECLSLMPLPCVPVPVPSERKDLNRSCSRKIGMIPPLISYAFPFIEACDKNEDRLYRVSVKGELVDKCIKEFITGNRKSKEYNVHVLCAAVKTFLCNARHPLIPPISRTDFLHCTDLEATDELRRTYRHLIENMPLVNRRTLAYLILHVKRLLNEREKYFNKRIVSDIFAPLLFGQYSSSFVDGDTEGFNKEKVAFLHLLSLHPAYWSKILNDELKNTRSEENDGTKRSVSTPSKSSKHKRSLSSSNIPAYENIYIPLPHFKYVVHAEKEESLNQYIDHLTSDDDVPYQLTEYINDEESKMRVREHLRPEKIPRYFQQRILKRQPIFAPYFSACNA